MDLIHARGRYRDHLHDGRPDLAADVAAEMAAAGYPGLHEHIDRSPDTALRLAREDARRERHWQRADQLRDRLLERGFIVEDHRDGTSSLHRAD